ncbi:tRNA pseudouridine13 synthase [Halarchaeum rubridurum]|uniref:Probable tRNA pseudouridine synthase D n=1 Tax=Halarchaeum rubridurum TaxID=489911 RepID=A0A830G036_9EURY|nr:tRNA pseudouridine(13) synthase TruD [Halarchaeum rubridurum]MBP1955154.1 tRNA pseudouridine13 synthase [Halarchaeum rubridurum]GGM68522.1 tRNA pseudouridine(13) synthase TruD [Halarchaeum rubridurum]
MRDAHDIERAVGIDHYVSDAPGTGGSLRESAADFRVRELEAFDTEPVDADTGDYPHLVFRATLTNWDTNGFARDLSNKLGISRERVSWAGTKDRNAVTTQLFSVRGVDAADLPEIGNAAIEPVGRAGRPIRFGDLRGNAFTIVVRDADPDPVDDVTRELTAFGGADGDGGSGARGASDVGGEADDGTGDATGGATSVGVPNVFGQQRFGSYRPVTHEVGLAVLRGDWEGAVMAYVGNPSPDEPPETREARTFVEETRDWSAAIERFPRRLRYERAVLNTLAENGGGSEEDYREALETFPSNLQRLFVHAAQSYVFNRICSERLERGLPFDRAVAGDVVCFADTDGEPVLPDIDRTQRVTEGRVEVVNRHLERGRAFVTAPLVGTDTEFGEGEPGEIERAVCADVGVERDDFDLPGSFGSTGTRRAILLTTDLAVSRDPLTFEFALPKGSYATVLLREYLKSGPLDL